MWLPEDIKDPAANVSAVQLLTAIGGIEQSISALSWSRQFAKLQLQSSKRIMNSLLGLQESAQKEVGSLRWGDFKPRLADAMVAMLEPIQQQYQEIRADDTYLTQVRSY